MRKFNASYVNWLLSYYAKNFGLWGLLGVTLVILGLLFYTTKIMDVDNELNRNLAEYQQLESNKTIPVPLSATPTVTTEQEIADFYKLFPNGANLPKLLGQIDHSAVKQSLILNRADYKLTQTKQGKLIRYEIVLPVIGKYIQIRQFIVALLHQLPALALTDMQIKRENSMSSVVEARLVFVLFLQGDQW